MRAPTAGPSASAPRSRSRWQLALMVAVVVSVFALLAAARLEPLAGDLAINMAPAPPEAVASRIAVVVVTEETLAAFPYRSPIDRGFLAALIDRLDAAGVRAVGIDILVDQPSDPAKDAAFFAAMDRARAPITLALATSADGLTERQGAYIERHVLPRRHGLIALGRDEIDGVVRHLPKPGDNGGTRHPTFATSIAGAAGITPDNTAGSSRILYSARQAAEPDAPAVPFSVYPAHVVSLLPDDWLSGKYVLVGTDLPTIDRHPTPFVTGQGSEAGTIPGVIIHAHILAQQLAGLSLPVAPPAMRIAITGIAALFAACLFLLPWPPRWLTLCLALALAAWAGTCLWLVGTGSLLPPLVAPPLAALAAAALMSVSRWQAERSERAFLRLAFSRYVSPPVVARIASGRLALALGGEKRRVTYIFTDLEGFTSLSEKLPPGELADILNPYLDEMCRLMTEHGATIDKIIGDAVVGFFGAPDDDPEQETHAVALSLALDTFAQGYRQQMAARGLSLGATRIGLHCGEAVIGNFGGSRFFDYTGIGDTVNTAARLEGANRFLGTRVLMSETVAAGNTGHPVRPAAELVLKGRSTPLPCHVPLGPDEDAEDGASVDSYRNAYQLMAAGDPTALAAFEAVLRQRPDDPLARLHVKRLHDGERGATLVLEGK
ncbi:CHASE2 domain-containing protein [Stappia sp.]|uniref:CHASE2 domain-containing protein n=1 Tax=Stappia sp. TaxID=1870903 RepID=UPI003A99A422